MQLALTRDTERSVKIEVFDDEGKILLQKVINRFSEKDQSWLAKLTKWKLPETMEHLNEAARDIDPLYHEAELDTRHIKRLSEALTSVDTEEILFTITYRELTSTRKYAQLYQDTLPQDCLRYVFENTQGIEPIIEWTDTARMACLDIDYHDMELADRPKLEELQSYIRAITPQPYCWHPSHAGGAKLYYVGSPGFNADELAAIAGLAWCTLDSRATFDILASSRHPGFDRIKDKAPAPNNIEYLYGQADTSHVRRLLYNELAPEEVEDLLEENGWKIGQMRPHSECLIAPDDRDRLCVYVGDMGLYCHSCASKGLGHGRPGMYPYAMMVRKTDSRLGNIVKNFCHWEHAKIILENIYRKLTPKCLEHIYRSLLKIYHSIDDPRIDMVFSSGRGVVRALGHWVTADGLTNITSNVDILVKSLPAVLTPSPNDDALKVNIPKMVAFSNAGDLSDYGYPSISFIRGCKIYGQKLDPKSEENTKIIIRKEFENHPPRYLIESNRMAESEAWELIEEVFPDINRNYLKLIIAAKGASEGRLAQCPYLLISGISSAGKSTTAQIAAGFCGEKAEEVVFTRNIERYRQAMMDATQQSGIIVINEIFKDAKAQGLTPIQALNPTLTITEESRSHVLWTGSVAFGRLPVFIFTDIECPPEVTQDIQIARRFTYFSLYKKAKWDDKLIEYDIRPHQFRTLSISHAMAADTILSSVIDQFFSTRMSLQEMAGILEADTFESEGIEEREIQDSDLLEFYHAILAAPPLTASHASRYGRDIHGNDKGYRLITRTGNDTPLLTKLWNMLCDGEDGDDWYSSRKVSQIDWSKIIGVDFSVRCKYAAYKPGRVIYVRFESCDAKKRGMPSWVNGQPRKTF